MSQVTIGIDPNTSLLYEGTPSLYGHAIWPSPFLAIASHVGPLQNWQSPALQESATNAQMLFREDFFDPVARVRRGRLYVRRPGVNPETWHVQRHPAYATSGQSSMARPNVVVAPDTQGFLVTRLTTFMSWRASDEFFAGRRDAVLVLGSGSRTVVHAVLDIERLATGEELITIRTRANLSGLPNLIDSRLPEQHSALIIEQYEKAANAAFRDDAESVIDRCREAATAALNAQRATMGTGGESIGKDLAKLAGFFAQHDRFIVANSAQTLALLHSRAKSVERLNRGTQAPSEADAELAISLLGSIYRELGWA